MCGRSLAALPLVKRGDQDEEIQIALVNAILSIVASLLGDGQPKRMDPETEDRDG
jgi:hypothetical protein